jgi:hypothetical protein
MGYHVQNVPRELIPQKATAPLKTPVVPLVGTERSHIENWSREPRLP